MGLGNLPVVDVGVLPVEEGHWKGGSIPSSEDVRDIRLHELEEKEEPGQGKGSRGGDGLCCAGQASC